MIEPSPTIAGHFAGRDPVVRARHTDGHVSKTIARMGADTFVFKHNCWRLPRMSRMMSDNRSVSPDDRVLVESPRQILRARLLLISVCRSIASTAPFTGLVQSECDALRV
jgi:hypothetical protein